ncbi:MAG TPA: antibiotic biosynthesis monooxygenase [Bradyrhizobium sp.]
MAEIRHQIAIEAPPEKVYAALATQAGLRSWWTADTVADHKTGGKAEFGFAQYRVKPSGVDKVKRAIAEFVPYVRANEPGTKLYQAWQQKDDPTRFVHFFIFEDEAAHAAHAGSEAVKRFEAAYRPELSEGDVVFTDYQLVAANRR